MDFRILGPVGSWVEDQEIPLNGTKQRTLLATLLLARERVVSDHEIATALWGKKPPETYQSQIYTYASRLRLRLHPGVEIVRRGSGYLMRLSGARFDYAEFETISRSGLVALQAGRHREAADLLRNALGLWRGPTLTDVTDHLAEAEGPSIEEARMDALEWRIEADLALGRHDRLTVELVRLVGVHPLRERLRAQLMVALYRSDRQADAFAVFHEGRQQLERELGVNPGSALRGTYQAILTGNLKAAASP